jgi:preprotein translocase SecE subunit
VANFLVQVWAELRRVQWPDRNQVTQATGVVVVFCFLAGAYLALWDFVFSEFVTWLL